MGCGLRQVEAGRPVVDGCGEAEARMLPGQYMGPQSFLDGNPAVRGRMQKMMILKS